MPAIYLCDVIGGTGPHDYFRSSISNYGVSYANLMIDDNPAKPANKRKAVSWSPDVTLTGADLTLVGSGTTKEDLIASLQATNLTNQMRNRINNWTLSGDLANLPAGPMTVYDAIIYVARQINPAVDLSMIVV